MINGNMTVGMTKTNCIGNQHHMKERDSNMELLRCTAMFLVVLVHTGFLSLGLPTQEESLHTPISVFFRFLTQSVSIVCVNVFVLLSGWYGIRFNPKRLGAFLFQVFFFSVLVYSCLVILCPSEYLNAKSLSVVFILNGEDYWFVKSYALLFLFAPFLNALVENENNNLIVKHILIAFFVFQSIYGWLSINGAAELEGGYSAFSFMGLYLLIRYLRNNDCFILKYSNKQYLLLFFSIAVFNTLLAFLLTRMNLIIYGRIFTYTNPLVICQSLLLVFAFSQFKIRGQFVNWLAKSCFAVYLTHANGFILRPFYGRWIKHLFDKYDTMMFALLAVCTIVLVFFVSTVLDQIRLLIWAKISGK